MSVDLSVFLTRWLGSRRLAFANVRLWHLAEIKRTNSQVCFVPMADMAQRLPKARRAS